jgi:hypothetical protein
MQVLFASLMLVASSSITDFSDSAFTAARAAEPQRVRLPMRQSIELELTASLDAETSPPPKYPKSSGVQYSLANASSRRHWREWVSLGYERAWWESPDPVVFVVTPDTAGGPPATFFASGTRVRRFGFGVRGGFDRLFGGEPRPLAFAGVGLATQIGQVTVFGPTSSATDEFAAIGLVARAGAQVRAGSTDLFLRLSWIPSYVASDLAAAKGRHHQIVVSFGTGSALSVPKRATELAGDR